MERICSACLSMDRRLFKLEDLRSLYDLLIPDMGYDIHSYGQVQICWECRNTLRKCDQFQKNAVKAIDFLVSCHLNPDSYDEQALFQQSQSTLSTSLRTDFDYKHTYEEPFIDDTDPPRIKQEPNLSPSSENLEPDPIPYCVKQEPDIEMSEEPLTRALLERDIHNDEYSQSACRVKLERVEIDYEPFVESEDGLPNVPNDPLSEVAQNAPQPLMQSLQNSKVQSYQMPEVANQSGTKLPKSALERTRRSTNQTASEKGEPNQKLKSKEPEAMNVKEKKFVKCYGSKKSKDLQEIHRNDLAVPKHIETPTAEEKSFEATLPDKKYKITLKPVSELIIPRANTSKEARYVSPKDKCTDCIVGFDSKQKLEDHLAAVHTKSPNAPSQGRVYTPPEQPASQLAMSQSELCERAYRDIAKMATHDRGSRRPYECAVCGDTCSSIRKLKAHIALHRRRLKQDQYVCDLCSITCKDWLSWKCHRSSAHGKKDMQNQRSEYVYHQERYICDVCKKWFPGLAALKTHYSSDHGLNLEEKLEASSK